MPRPPRRPDAAVDALRSAALDALGAVDATPRADDRSRRPRPVDASLAALFPQGAVLLHELLAAAQKAWRDATEREAPSLERLGQAGVVTRVDADPASGYLAVTTAEETYRAFVPREHLATLVALLLRRPIEQVARELGGGPRTLAP